MAINVIQYGTGKVGKDAIQLMLRKGFNIVAAIDKKADYLGRDVGELIGLGSSIGVKVTNDVQSVIKNVKADVVCHATVTKLDQTYDQIRPFIEAGVNVVSSAEELVYPWIASPDLAKEIDENAKAHNVSVIGSGISPGFLVDLVPLTFASGCWNIDKIRILTVADFSVVGPAFGTLRFGITPEEFRKGVLEKRIPLYTGFYQAMGMISDALGWKLDNMSQFWEPLISKSVRKTPWLTVDPGTIAGWRQSALGSISGEVKMIFETYFLIHPNPEEDGVEAGRTISIEGKPSLSVKIKGDAENSDLIVSARLVNIIPAVLEAEPGLICVKDLPVTPPLPDKILS